MQISRTFTIPAYMDLTDLSYARFGMNYEVMGDSIKERGNSPKQLTRPCRCVAMIDVQLKAAKSTPSSAAMAVPESTCR